MDTVTLKRDEAGNVVRVDQQVMTNEFTLNREWILQQIKFHSDQVIEFQRQLAAYDSFIESEEEAAVEVALPQEVTPNIVDTDAVAQVTEVPSES